MSAVNADKEFLVRRAMTKGYQLLSLLAPPCYVAWILLGKQGRSGLSLNRILRATWVGGAVGISEGGALEYLRSANSSEELIRTRRIEASYNTASIRADDHCTIGSILSSVLTPALFWNRARAIHLILGGAGLGSSAGLLVHYGRTLSGDPPTKIQVPQLTVS